MGQPTTDVWKESTFSGGQEGGECVEVSNLGALRDSKNFSVVLHGVDLAAFVATVKRPTQPDEMSPG
jgi:hypothetical protein